MAAWPTVRDAAQARGSSPWRGSCVGHLLKPLPVVAGTRPIRRSCGRTSRLTFAAVRLVFIQRVKCNCSDFREGEDVAEQHSSAGMVKLLNGVWLRPFLFLIFIVIAWDVSIRLFRIPPYQIPAPADVVAVLWQDWPELLGQAWPTTYAT